MTRCSRDLRYQFVSRAYAEMIGRRPADIAGKAIVEIMEEEGFETIRPYIETVLQGTRVEFERDVRLDRLDGTGVHPCAWSIHLTRMREAMYGGGLRRSWTSGNANEPKMHARCSQALLIRQTMPSSARVWTGSSRRGIPAPSGCSGMQRPRRSASPSPSSFQPSVGTRRSTSWIA